jgi:hypothetical protein
MTRKITITIEEEGPPGPDAVASCTTHSSTGGPGAVADQIAATAAGVTAMWAGIDAASTKPAVPR